MMEINNEVTTQEKKSPKVRIFILRMLGYMTFGLIIPLAFLIWRFGLFQQTSKLNIGGWGIVAIIFASVFFIKLIKQSEDCVDSLFLKQIFRSISKVFIPLLAVTLCVYAVGDFWKELINFLMVLTICEPIAYVLNPFPEYLKEKEKEEQTNTVTKIIGMFWDKKK